MDENVIELWGSMWQLAAGGGGNEDKANEKC